jgi:hypothetical protein
MNIMVHTPNWITVDFDTAVVRPGATSESYVLTVTGTLRRTGEASLGVKLVANIKYPTEPEYWEITVLWDEADAILIDVEPYKICVPLDGIRGSKGVEVIGKSKSLKINVPKTVKPKVK